MNYRAVLLSACMVAAFLAWLSVGISVWFGIAFGAIALFAGVGAVVDND